MFKESSALPRYAHGLPFLVLCSASREPVEKMKDGAAWE